MSARTELISLLECVVPLDRARTMVDLHHAEVAEYTKRATAVRAQGALPMPTGVPTCTAPHSPSCSCAGDEYRFCGATLANRTEYPFTCNRRVAHTGPCSGYLDQNRVKRSREDPHDSPLHQSYALPHDLPEFLASLSGGDLPADAVREKRCLLPPIGCGRALVDSVAVTATESAEYRITGLCPTCQDRIADVPEFPAQRDQRGQA